MMKNGSMIAASVVALPTVSRSSCRHVRRRVCFTATSISRCAVVLQRPDQALSREFTTVSGVGLGTADHPQLSLGAAQPHLGAVEGPMDPAGAEAGGGALA